MLVAARTAAWAKSGGWVNPYVTDGLVAMWDGEWNAGGGVYEESSKIWKDIAGQNDLALGLGIYFRDGRLVCNGNGCGAFRQGTLNTETVELVLSRSSNTRSYDCVFVDSDTRYSAEKKSFGFFGKNFSSKILWAYNYPDENIGRLVSILVDKVNKRVYFNGVEQAPSRDAIDWAWSAAVICVGGRNLTGAADYTSTVCFLGEIAACRAYRRALTKDERDANYAIDKARFNLP